MEDLNLSYTIGDTHNLIENNMHGKNARDGTWEGTSLPKPLSLPFILQAYPDGL